MEETQVKFATLPRKYINNVGRFVDPSRKSVARTREAITSLWTNSPKLNNQLKEERRNRMLGKARRDEYIQQLAANKATIAASSKKKDVTAVVSKGLYILKYPSKSDKEQIKARALGDPQQPVEACRRALVNQG